MLKVYDKAIERMEEQYPEITKQILNFENADLLACPQCGSEDTADVQVGIIGRTIYIASATLKFTLIPNGPKPGRYFCNSCKKYFGEVQENDEQSSGFTLRPRDKSLQAFKDFCMQVAKRMGGKFEDSLSEEEWKKNWKAFWDKGKKIKVHNVRQIYTN